MLVPAEPKYTFSPPNFLEGKVEEVKENIVTLNIGNNKIVSNLAPWKAKWKKGDEVRGIVKPDDVILAREKPEHR